MAALTIQVRPEFFYYIKTCLKRPLKNKTKNWFLKPITAYCRSKVLQNALLDKDGRINYSGKAIIFLLH